MRYATAAVFAYASATLVSAQFLLTEVQPTPTSGEPEWIECINHASTSLKIEGWRICDSRACVRIPTITVAAGGILVLTTDVEALHEVREVPSNVAVVQCPFPSLNNGSDQVTIRGADSVMIDSMSYDMRRFRRGVSLERCGMWESGSVIYSSTWQSSPRRDSASCGLLNGCVALPHDLRVMPLVVQDSTVAIIIRNVGLHAARSCRRRIEIGAFTMDDVIPTLEPQRQDELIVPISSIGLADTVRRIVVHVDLDARDDRPDNDTLVEQICIPCIGPCISITELMAEPHERQTEYVEIRNGTARPVDLGGWTLQDGSSKVAVILPPAVIAPGEFLAVAADTSIAAMATAHPWTLMRPALNVNADRDLITLRTPEGVVVDKATYDHAWHVPLPTTRGIALERRVPWSTNHDQAAAWTSSVDRSGGTPGRDNSINRPPPVISGLRSWPDPCSAESSSSRFPCVISWEQPIEQAIGRLRVLDLQGTVKSELLNGQLIGRQGSAVWDLRTDQVGSPVPVGVYVAVLECTSITTAEYHVDRCLINVGETSQQLRKR
ncbi:MAG: hypothetical protein RL594_754 [Bacteroidota bacterium]|jgi:hypothetical protein